MNTGTDSRKVTVRNHYYFKIWTAVYQLNREGKRAGSNGMKRSEFFIGYGFQGKRPAVCTEGGEGSIWGKLGCGPVVNYRGGLGSGRHAG